MEKPMHLPSAGMIRFRFDGFAFASQPFQGHPEVGANIGESRGGARGLGKGMLATPGGWLLNQRQPIENAVLIQPPLGGRMV
jgi:hypothetical protein